MEAAMYTGLGDAHVLMMIISHATTATRNTSRPATVRTNTSRTTTTRMTTSWTGKVHATTSWMSLVYVCNYSLHSKAAKNTSHISTAG